MEVDGRALPWLRSTLGWRSPPVRGLGDANFRHLLNCHSTVSATDPGYRAFFWRVRILIYRPEMLYSLVLYAFKTSHDVASF